MRICSYKLTAAPSVFVSVIVNIGTSTSLRVATSRRPCRQGNLGFFAPGNKLRNDSISSVLGLSCSVGSTKLGNAVRGCSLVSICTRRLQGAVVGRITGNSGPLSNLGVSISTNGNATNFCTCSILRPLNTSISNDRFARPGNVFPGRVPGPRGSITVTSTYRVIGGDGSSFNLVFSASTSEVNYISSDKHRVGEGHLITLTSIVTLRNGPNNAIIASDLASSNLHRFVRGALKNGRVEFGHNCGGIVSGSVRLGGRNIGSPLTVRADNRTTLGRGCFLSSNTCLTAGVIVLLTGLGGSNGGVSSLVDRLGRPTRDIRVHVPVLLSSFERCNRGIVTSLGRRFSRVHNCSCRPMGCRNMEFGVPNN